MSRDEWQRNSNNQLSRLWGLKVRSDFTGTGLFFSLVFHCFILLPIVTIWSPDDVPELQSYSVSIVPSSHFGGPRAGLNRQLLQKMTEASKAKVTPKDAKIEKPALKQEKPFLIKSPSPAPDVKPTEIVVPTKKVEPTAKPTKVPPTKVPPTKAPPTKGIATKVATVIPSATIARATVTPLPTTTPRPTATKVPERTPTPTETPDKRRPLTAGNYGGNDSEIDNEAESAESTRREQTRETVPQNRSADQEYNRMMEKYIGSEGDSGSSSNDTPEGSQKFGATGGVGGQEQRPPEYFSYIDLMRGEIDRRWVWHLRHEGLKTHIKMQIAEDGSINFAEIVKGSGNLDFDRSVMRAVQAADPFPAPPGSVYRYFENIIVIFDPNE